MSGQIPPAIRVLLHWYKHTLAEVRGRPVRTVYGKLEEYGDPDNCDVCVAVLLGQEYSDPDRLLEVAEKAMRRLTEEVKRRGAST